MDAGWKCGVGCMDVEEEGELGEEKISLLRLLWVIVYYPPANIIVTSNSYRTLIIIQKNRTLHYNSTIKIYPE